MIPRSKTTGRNRPRPNYARPIRRPQPTQPNTSNNPDHWQRQYDHYCQLAQATNGDDAVTREQHWQHAEYFLRMLNRSAT